MNRQEKIDKVFNECISEMFKRVGKEFDEEYCKDKTWYQKESWTESEQNDFRDWMVKHLKKNLKMNNKKAEWEVDLFILDYGWTTVPKEKKQW